MINNLVAANKRHPFNDMLTTKYNELPTHRWVILRVFWPQHRSTLPMRSVRSQKND